MESIRIGIIITPPFIIISIRVVAAGAGLAGSAGADATALLSVSKACEI
jgi:hypothetical protein